MTEPTRMRQIRPPLFVERQTYRRRRLMDAARVLPALGLFLWWVPLLWGQSQTETVATSSAVLYIFGVWVVLIVAAVLISSPLRVDDGDRAEQDSRR